MSNVVALRLRPELSKSELAELHSVLRRAAERAERNRDQKLLARLEQELAVIDFEMRAG